MAKTLISRLDAENIVRAAVDPETHEATGDVYDSVNDISYPFGGGGESSLTPILKLTLTEDSRTYTAPMYCIVDGHVLADELEISAGDYIDILIHDESSFFGYMLSDTDSSNYQVTDMVNCTLLVEGEAISLEITDPSQNASATLKITGGLS